MIDAWIKIWTEGSQKLVSQTVEAPFAVFTDMLSGTQDSDVPVLANSMAAPFMAPALIGATAVNTAAASWMGLLMSGPAAGAAAMNAFIGGSSPAPKPVRKAKAIVKATAVKKPSAPKAPAAKSPAAKAPAVKAAGKPAAAVTAPKVDDRPAGLDAPKGGKADDLKRISGVGPKLESVLNDLGIYHFDQIAVWTKKEIAWVDDYLRFKGRIERDRWIDQAKAFAKEAA